MIQPNSPIVADPSNRLPQLETNVIKLRFALAATIDDTSTVIWKDVFELVKYLMTFDKVITCNGNKFDLPILSAEIAKTINPALIEPEAIVASDEFYQPYSELYKKSWDILQITKDITGSIVGLANLAEATLKIKRQHNIKTATAALEQADVITACNFCLEGASLCYNLHHVVTQLHKLALKGPDDKVTIFDV